METDESERRVDQRSPAGGSGAHDGRPGWWHRDHPTFASLAGFFTGLLFVTLVPGTYAALLGVSTDSETAEELFPLILVMLAVPVALAVVPRTRRFGWYMLVGILTTAVVVLGSAGVVLWYLYRFGS